MGYRVVFVVCVVGGGGCGVFVCVGVVWGGLGGSLGWIVGGGWGLWGDIRL